MQPAKKAKKKEDNKYPYRPIEISYYRDLCSGEYYTRIIYYLI